ncbi:hypothetical protein HL670_01202 [Serratia plymuthica]|nr:hypothetical protein HL670_01202 [Serratia plymuthica]
MVRKPGKGRKNAGRIQCSDLIAATWDPARGPRGEMQRHLDDEHLITVTRGNHSLVWRNLYSRLFLTIGHSWSMIEKTTVSR